MKTVIITGANRLDGIGFHVAQILCKAGHQVIITARTVAAGEEACRKIGSGCCCLPLEVHRELSRRQFLGELSKLTSKLDILINNAALLADGEQSVLNVTEQQMSETFAVNSIAPVMMVQLLLPLLQRSSQARIINVSSGAGQLSDGTLATWAPAYSASKAALNALTQQLAANLPSFAVNSVCPGWCHTRMGGAQAPRTPLQGADTIAWLATEADQKISGKFFRDRAPIPW